MLRSKNLVIVSHCVLNQDSVVCPEARAKGAFKFASELIKSGVGIIQLPCPELRHLGITRKPMTKDEYDTPEYRELSRELFAPILRDLEDYLQNGFTIKGLIGINQSPSCSISGKRGVFMEEMFKMLDEKGIKLNYIEVPADYDEEKNSEKFTSEVKKLLNA